MLPTEPPTPAPSSTEVGRGWPADADSDPEAPPEASLGVTSRGLPAARAAGPGEDALLPAGTLWRMSFLPDTPTAGGGPAPDGAGCREEIPAAPAAAPGYLLRRLIGQGGMGEVWEAEQAALARSVAVKRIRPDLDGETRRRDAVAFRQEALITARLEHPNIVPIYDYGHDEDGEPLLAMKMVRGRPWHDLIVGGEGAPAGETDALARHLGILKDVAQAVAFAHARGIVHRDLKPSQVIVGEFGEVLLADWGLAVAYDSGLHLGEALPVTSALPSPATASSPAGTPVFMAPEQTRPSAAGIGPWTDVYLLGGILYFLLTRTYPHQAATRDVAMALAAAGRVEPPRDRAPHRPIPAELADLAMEAMRPDPARRIASAREFVRRLDAYLTGATRRQESEAIVREVAARLPELRARGGAARYGACGELLQRTARALHLWPDHAAAGELEATILAAHADAAIDARDFTLARAQAERVADAATRASLLARIERGERRARLARLYLRASAAVILLFTVVFGVVAVEMRRQRDALDVALADAEAERARAETANRELARQLELGEGVMSFMVNDLVQKLRPERRLEVMKVVTREVLAYYERQPGGLLSPAGRLHRAQALVDAAEVLGDDVEGGVGRAVVVAEEAVAIARALLDAPAGLTDDEHAQARLLLAEATNTAGDMWRRRGDLERSATAYEQSLAASRRVEQDVEVIGLHWGALARQGLSEVSMERGDLDRALALRREEVATWRRLARSAPGGEWQAVVAVAPDFLWGALVRLAELHTLRGEFADAHATMEEAAGLLDRADRRGEPDPATLERMALFYNRVADLAFDEGRVEDALAASRRLLDVARRLTEHDPANAQWRRRVAAAEGNVGLAVSFTDADAARAHFQRADAILEELQRDERDDAELLFDRAVNIQLLAGTYRHTGRPEEAAAGLERAIALFESLVASDATNLFWLEGLSHTWRLLAEVEVGRGDRLRAEQTVRAMVAAHERLVEREPGNVRWASELARGMMQLAELREGAGDYAEAEAIQARHAALRRRLLAERPDYPRSSQWLAGAELSLGRLRAYQGRYAEARATLESALALEHVEPDAQQLSKVLDQQVATCITLGLVVAREGGDSRAAYPHLRDAIERAARARAAAETRSALRGHSMGWRVLALMALEAGDLDLAAEALGGREAAVASGGEGDLASPELRLEAALAAALALELVVARGAAPQEEALRAAREERLAAIEAAVADGRPALYLYDLVGARVRLLRALGRDADAAALVAAAAGRGLLAARVVEGLPPAAPAAPAPE